MNKILIDLECINDIDLKQYEKEKIVLIANSVKLGENLAIKLKTMNITHFNEIITSSDVCKFVLEKRNLKAYTIGKIDWHKNVELKNADCIIFANAIANMQYNSTLELFAIMPPPQAFEEQFALTTFFYKPWPPIYQYVKNKYNNIKIITFSKYKVAATFNEIEVVL